VSEPTCLSDSIIADTIMRTIELGVTITDAALDDEVTVVFCDLLVDGPDRCPQCGSIGRYRDTIVRTVTDLPMAGHPLQLRMQVPRYRCENASCEREVFRHNTDRLARPGSSTTRRCAHHVVRRLMVDRTSIAAIARELGLSWDTGRSPIVGPVVSRADSYAQSISRSHTPPAGAGGCIRQRTRRGSCTPMPNDDVGDCGRP
jgi:transposase